MQQFSERRAPSPQNIGYWPLIVGGYKEPCNLLDVTMPFDGRLLARVETAGVEHVDHSLDIAFDVFRDRRAWLPLAERIGVLERSARIMSRMQDTLAITASRESGKPLLDSRVEVRHAIDEAKCCIVHLRSDAGRVVPTAASRETANRIALTRYEPAGVVVAVGSFNQTLNVVVQRIFAAVAAGCPVIVKPAGDTPLSSLQIATVLRQAGLPAPWCQVLVADDAATTERLVTDVRSGVLDPDCRAPAFAFVLGDAIFSAAAESITRGAFYHAGQAPASLQRILVPGHSAREFAGLLAERASNLAVGDPVAVTTAVGPLIQQSEVTRVTKWVDEAVCRGAELLTGGSAVGYSLYRPTVLLNPSSDTILAFRDINGPVITVYASDSLDAAIARANVFALPAHAAVFTGNLDAALRVFGQLNASVVTVNDWTASDLGRMPFTVSGHSGRGDVRHAIDKMRLGKMLVVNSREL